MKYIILILLISFAFGQDIGAPFWFSDEYRKGATYEPIDIRFITLGDLLEYAEECYNDSFPVGWIPTGNGSYMSAWKHEEGYVHKKPTFKGFIEWINR